MRCTLHPKKRFMFSKRKRHLRLPIRTLSPHFSRRCLPGRGLFMVCFTIVTFKTMAENLLPFRKGVR